jgi:hypothetical protein
VGADPCFSTQFVSSNCQRIKRTRRTRHGRRSGTAPALPLAGIKKGEVMGLKRTDGTAKTKMKRKVYEQELHKLQIQLSNGSANHNPLRRSRRSGQGRDDQGHHRTREPARVSCGGASGSLGSRENADVRAAIHSVLSGSGRDRDLRPQLDNRAGVEYVMGFCSERDHRKFLDTCPQIERYIVDAGRCHGRRSSYPSDRISTNTMISWR